MVKGKLITFEGIDGSGKSSASKAAAEFLKGQKINSILIRQPGGTKLGEEIRNILKHHPQEIEGVTEVVLLMASFRASLEEIIKPNINKGVWVLCDRFTDSTIAYQSGGKGVELNKIQSLIQHTLDIKPDLTFYYDLPASIGLQRAKERGEPDNFEKKGVKFQESIRIKYLELVKENPQRIKLIDTIKNNEKQSKELTINALKKFCEINMLNKLNTLNNIDKLHPKNQGFSQDINQD